MPLPRALARINRIATNRVLGRFVGLVPALVEVQHRGRRTGRRYATPVAAFRVPGGFAIAMTYGPDTDWARNVLAAGRATLRHRGGETDVEDPRLLTGQEALAVMPRIVRPALRLLRAPYALRVTAR